MSETAGNLPGMGLMSALCRRGKSPKVTVFKLHSLVDYCGESFKINSLNVITTRFLEVRPERILS